MLVAATGTAKVDKIVSVNDPRAKFFKIALQDLMRDLAKLVVKDGEGASKFIEINVIGASNDSSASLIAKNIANSPLVKTAIAGQDPNWGRIIMAIGKSEIKVIPEKLKISFGENMVAEAGCVSPLYSKKKVSTYMKGKKIIVNVDLGMNLGKSTVWTCDLTHEYISINADYRS
jgi:glutamate N-acetyltransferase/amino-acid N-acetyltransferase